VTLGRVKRTRVHLLGSWKVHERSRSSAERLHAHRIVELTVRGQIKPVYRFEGSCTAVCISIETFEEFCDEEERLRVRDVVLLRAFLLCFIPFVFHMTMALVLRMEEGQMSSQIHSCHFLLCPETVDTHRLHLVCNISHGGRGRRKAQAAASKRASLSKHDIASKSQNSAKVSIDMQTL
jgi:hypothetical protein